MVQGPWRFPYFNNGRFANYAGEKTRKTLWRTIGALMRLVFDRKNNYEVEELKQWMVPLEANNEYSSTAVKVTWIGHSTFLIQAAGKTILTDPIFDDLNYFLTFKRLAKPGIPFHSLPKIDVVLLSHNHPDHMDEKSLLALKKYHNPLMLIPQGDKNWFDRRGFDKVKEFSWWDNIRLVDGLVCTFLPAIHWSQRGFFDRNKSLWGGWMIEASGGVEAGTVYFAGDTAYGSHFKVIADAFPFIDVALMPVGASEPRSLTSCSHVSPEEAGKAFLELRADYFIPMHWGTYHLGVEKPFDPLRRIKLWWSQYAHELNERRLLCMKFGEQFAFSSRIFQPLGNVLPLRRMQTSR